MASAPAASAPAPTPAIPYRPEIDGLRAVAVLAVILHHFSAKLLPGGYLGVDVFFVISGYVITASLAARPATGLGDLLLGFYGRRIRRLLPALLACVLITAALLCLVSPEPGLMLGVGWRSLFGLSNITLYHLAVDYFRPAIALHPFAQTWSLGVEEQFYLLFPLLLWFSGFCRSPGRGRATPLLLGVLALASLLILLRWLVVDQPAAYYLLPARFWELAAGALLFLALLPRPTAPGRLPAWGFFPPLLALVALVGLMALPLAFGALPLLGAVGLTTLLIGSLRPGTAAQHLLSRPPLVFLGLISYSLYLWHWSVLSLSRWTVGVSASTALWQVPLILVLAVLSWRCLEEPLRRASWWPNRWQVVATGLLLAGLGTGVLQGLSRYGSARLYGGDPDSAYRDPNRPASGDSGSAADCSSRSRGRLLLVGDSHAHHFMAAAPALCQRHGLAYGESATVGAPYPPLHYTNPATGMDQESSSRYALVAEQRWDQLIQPDGPPVGRQGVVVLSLRSPLYFDPGYLGEAVLGRTGHFDPLGGAPVARQEALQRWIAAVAELVDRHRQTRFVLLLPTPEFGGEVPMELCRPQWFRPRLPAPCLEGQDRRGLDRFAAFFEAELRRGLAGRPNLLIHNPAAALCGPQRCPRLRQGALLYSDGDHLSAYGASLVLDGLVADLQRRGLLAAAPAVPGTPAAPAATAPGSPAPAP